MMAQARQNARSSRREELPDAMRIYGLEGITETQDEALTQLALTTARHDERLGAHDVALATNNEQIKTLVIATTTLASSVNKLVMAVVTGSLGIAVTIIVAVAT